MDPTLFMILSSGYGSSSTSATAISSAFICFAWPSATPSPKAAGPTKGARSRRKAPHGRSPRPRLAGRALAAKPWLHVVARHYWQPHPRCPISSLASLRRRQNGGNVAASARRLCLAGGADFLQHRTQVGEKPRRVLAHGKMAEVFHHRQLGALDARRKVARIGGATGIVVLPGQQIERAGLGIERAQPAPHVPILRIKVKVTFEDAGAALHIVPNRLPALARRGSGGNQPRDDGAADLPTMYVRSMQPVEVIVGLGVCRRLQADQGAKAPRVLERQMQDDPAADRAAHAHRALQPKGIDDRHHRVNIGARGKTVFDLLPARRGRVLAVPGKVEGNDAKLGRERLIVHQAAKLTAVGTRRVQAQERNAAARLLDVEAIAFAIDLEWQVTADGGFELWESHGLLIAPVARRRRVARPTAP